MLAATSICAFSPSGRRRVMRAENESSAPACANRAGARLEPALKRAHDPGVDRGAFEIGGDLELRLQPFGQAQRDAGGEGVVARGLRGLRLLLFDVDELRIPAGEANLDPPRHRARQGERGLADDVQQSQVQRGAERLGEPATGLHGGLVVGERCCRSEVLLDGVDVVCQLHEGTMTSL